MTTQLSTTLSKPALTVRRAIEMLAQRADLPLSTQALATLEGQHPSHRRYGNDDFIDIHTWQPGDEARMMNWPASARTGEPMVSSRQRPSAGCTHIIIDTSIAMRASCDSGEYVYEVAANAACLLAALSIRRHDNVSMIGVDGSNLLHSPIMRTLPDCERNLDRLLDLGLRNERHAASLLSCVQRVIRKPGLVVLVTDEYALNQVDTETLQQLSRAQHSIVITIAPINPCAPQHNAPLFDALTSRKIPAFLYEERLAQEIASRRIFRHQALNKELSQTHSRLIRCASSAHMLRTILALCSHALYHSSYPPLPTG